MILDQILFLVKLIYPGRYTSLIRYEPPHGKTNNLQFAYTKTKAQISFAVTDHRLCFRNTDSTIIQNFKLLALFCDCTDRFVSECRTYSETTLFVFPRGGSYVNVQSTGSPNRGIPVTESLCLKQTTKQWVLGNFESFILL